jgi:hypothetical protein
MMPVGKTKDAGWQVGVSRTVPLTLEEAWARITDPVAWLGEEATDIRSHKPLDRIRVGWHGTIVQVALSPTRTGTRVTFHQDRMASAEERERQRTHWRSVADRLFPAPAP